MCDRAHFDDLNERVRELEAGNARLDERLSALVNCVNLQLRVAYVLLILVVLALIWGAVGERGFNAVVGERATKAGASLSE